MIEFFVLCGGLGKAQVPPVLCRSPLRLRATLGATSRGCDHRAPCAWPLLVLSISSNNGSCNATRQP